MSKDNIKKIAWPWIGSTEHEMGSMSDAFQDVDQAAYTGFDSLVPEKTLHDSTPPSTEYSESRVSPVDGDGEEMVLMDEADDEEGTVVSVFDNDNKVASFRCNIAKTFQDKVNGLQVYSSLGAEDGLLFEYSRPQDLLYHMGTVKFPIDIIFCDKDFKIKKIYSDIQPGTLATFGCADAQYVLEIAGGLSAKMNFETGNIIKVKRGKDTIKKSASLKISPKIVYVYNFDGLMSKNPNIKLSKIEEYDEDNITLRYDGNVFTPGNTIVSHIKNLGNFDGYAFSKTADGMYGFLKNSEEIKEIHSDLKSTLSDKNALVIFSTSYDSPVEVCKAFLSKLEVLYGSFKVKDAVICKIAEDYNHLNIIEDIRNIYPNSKIRLYADDDLAKKAGVPISSQIKEQAKEVSKSLDLAKKSLGKSIENLKQNLVEYEKIKNLDEKITSTQGQYHQSTKRNVEIAKEYLLAIRDSIKVLNKIKDATTTMEIIESLASSSKVASERIQEIFDLVNQMNTPDFVMLLTESTNNYVKAAEDLEATIDRAKDYINKEILGIIVLST